MQVSNLTCCCSGFVSTVLLALNSIPNPTMLRITHNMSRMNLQYDTIANTSMFVFNWYNQHVGGSVQY